MAGRTRARMPWPGADGVVVALSVSLLLAGSMWACHRPDTPPRVRWDVDGDGVVRIAVLGDSNSFGWMPDNWMRRLRAHLDRAEPGAWQVRAYARPSASITENPKYELLGGQFQVGQALAATPPADVFVLAFGTNDHRQGVPNAAIVRAYRRAVGRIEQASRGARVLVATTPWCGDPDCDPERIAALDRLLRATWPPDAIVDFDTWVVPETHLLADHVHMNEAGHGRRLDAVLRLLFPG